ncbi:MAG TPA: carbohydrate kinase family protein, partial [Patescibacteria group bacterium]
FSRLKLHSACVSLLGDDHLKAYIISDLTADGVDTSLLNHFPGELTDYSVILVASDGGRTIITNRGSTCLESKNIDWDKIKGTSWFYISSLEGNIGLLEELVGFAHENNIKVALNPGNRELSQPSSLIPLLSYVDFLLLNRTESEGLTLLSADTPKFWEKLKSFGTPIIAVTNGRDGAHVLFDGQKFYSPIINTNPVDETGAGDSFGSAFVAALIHGLDPQLALQWGIHNSASVVSSLGAKIGLLTFDTMNLNLKDYAAKT